MLKGKNLKKCFILTIATVLTLTSVLAFHTTADAANTKKVKSVALKIGNKTITKKTYSLVKGKKATIKVKVTPKKAMKSVTYKTNNKKVATVSKKGVVTAKKKGTAKISVTVKGKNNKTKKTWVKIKVKEAKKPTNQTTTNKPSTTTVVTTVNPIKIEELTIQDGSDSIYGKVYRPKKEGVYPAIIMCHGYNGINTDFTTECRYFAQNGYVAYAFDFCGGSTRSKSSGKTTDMTIFTEKANLLSVFNYIKTLSYVNKDRIFVQGGSQGGLVTALAAEEIADEVKGMILYFPAFNIPDQWGNAPQVETEFWGLTLGPNFMATLHGFNAFDHIGNFSKNVLILYGEKDAIVPRATITRAQNAYQHCELKTYPNEGHGFTPTALMDVKRRMLEFMNNQ